MIPDFDVHGVLPPILPDKGGSSPERSPYPSTMLAVCQRFGDSAERRRILRGVLALRAALRAVGLAVGHQWIDGSFTEDVERLRGRAPHDADVVTFAVVGDEAAQREVLAADPGLFDSAACKRRYKVDHYLLPADRTLDEPYARRVGFGYSMWSHQRETWRWKGFVSVALDSDAEAQAWLEAQDAPDGGTP